MNSLSGLYFPIFGLLTIGLLVGLSIVLVSSWAGRRLPTLAKDTPYESGIDPKEDARHLFAVKFNVTALVFLAFDVEIAFLFPWAILFREGVAEGRGAWLILEMAVFLALVAVAWLYAVRRGGLEWE